MKTGIRTNVLATALLFALALPAFAQQAHDHAAMQMQQTGDADDTTAQTEPTSEDGMSHGASDHAGMDHAAMGHGSMDHASMKHDAMDHSQMDHAAMGHAGMDHAAMNDTTTQPREPIPTITDADRAAAFPDLHMHDMHTPSFNSYVLLDRLEGWNRDGGSGQAWEASAWFGGDINRLWLRSEGEREGGRTHAADLDVLYGHAISPWWDLLAGVRQQFRPDGSTWAALGVQGLAPYKFEVAATLYFGERSNSLLKLEAEYDVLLTHRLILQPKIETTFVLSGDAARSDGDTAEAGLRLRYEITRRFAPYIGWEHERRFGDGADVAREHGEPVRESRFVAGVRIWF
jgi:copper resistance protein B